MKTPGKPDNETDRLDHLNRLDILDTSAEDLFDDFTRLASMLCRTLFSTVSIIDDERQWFKSVQGPLGVDQTSRDVSSAAMPFCRMVCSSWKMPSKISGSTTIRS